MQGQVVGSVNEYPTQTSTIMSTKGFGGKKVLQYNNYACKLILLLSLLFLSFDIFLLLQKQGPTRNDDGGNLYDAHGNEIATQSSASVWTKAKVFFLILVLTLQLYILHSNLDFVVAETKDCKCKPATTMHNHCYYHYHASQWKPT